MDVQAAKMIGAGLAVFGLLGVGIGIGSIFSSLIQAISRNPESKPHVLPIGLLGFALTEAVAIFALVVAFLILFL